VNHLPFIVAAYAVTFLGTIVLALVSWRQMRKAERAAEELRREP
jgi:hypothetical protein